MVSPSAGGFTSLGEHAYILRPASQYVSSSSTDPTVILIFGWMSAKLSHLHKYTAMYTEIYPNATIILVRSPLSFFWTSARGFASLLGILRKARYRPVIASLEALGCFDDRQRILTHTFSNGGGFHLITLAGLLPKITQSPRSPSALIIDSSPGGATLHKTMLAVTSPIKNTLVRLLASGVYVVLYCFMWTVGHIINRPSPVQVMIDALRNPRVLPWIDERTPRLYLYSTADIMVPAADVEEHAARSASEGLDVRKLRFDKSAHVAHARVYPEEYWAAVKKLWADACQVKR
ncbi:hypothetical protein MVEN_02456300 [Mycena venus]|uniref:DUF829-domain-containing protein n=1 Tax=Mycena venus TaxID=2733690 RepID=A0A8H7CC65_9AGAR|nr:hypothetical protein MVEN_02456300 [Mycena venus]